MTLFNLKKLEEQLRNDQLSDRTAMYYLMINTLLYSLSAYLSTENQPAGWILWSQIAIVIISNVAGILITFEINSNGDNKDYFKRFQALVFVIGIRLFILIIGILIITSIISEPLTSHPLSDFCSSALFNTLYCALMIRSFKRLHVNAKRNRSNKDIEPIV